MRPCIPTPTIDKTIPMNIFQLAPFRFHFSVIFHTCPLYESATFIAKASSTTTKLKKGKSVVMDTCQFFLYILKRRNLSLRFLKIQSSGIVAIKLRYGVARLITFFEVLVIV